MSKILKSYQVASYMRLSREDGDKVLSDSIANQKAMIADYIKEHDGLILTDEFIDDGYSGTTFDSPAFARMMAAMLLVAGILTEIQEHRISETSESREAVAV